MYLKAIRRLSNQLDYIALAGPDTILVRQLDHKNSIWYPVSYEINFNIYLKVTPISENAFKDALEKATHYQEAIINEQI